MDASSIRLPRSPRDFEANDGTRVSLFGGSSRPVSVRQQGGGTASKTGRRRAPTDGCGRACPAATGPRAAVRRHPQAALALREQGGAVWKSTLEGGARHARDGDGGARCVVEELSGGGEDPLLDQSERAGRSASRASSPKNRRSIPKTSEGSGGETTQMLTTTGSGHPSYYRGARPLTKIGVVNCVGQDNQHHTNPGTGNAAARGTGLFSTRRMLDGSGSGALGLYRAIVSDHCVA